MNKRTDGSSDAAYVPVNVLDNEDYVKLGEPALKGFCDSAKDIDNIDVASTRCVVDYYKRRA